MNQKWIASFRAVAQAGSITAAAKSLFLSPQALLQQINLLEEEVGVPLFQRSSRGMALTVAGRELLRGMEELESSYNRTMARCRLASSAEKTIRIPMRGGFAQQGFMETLCQEYRRRWPEKMAVCYVDENPLRWAEGLSQLRFDITECYTLDRQSPRGIHFLALEPVPCMCLMDNAHPLAERQSLPPEELTDYPLLIPRGSLHVIRYLQIYLENHAIPVRMEEVPNDRYQILNALDRGGIYLTNREISREFHGFRVIPMDLDTHVWRGLACREEALPMYKEFLDLARELTGREKDAGYI